MKKNILIIILTLILSITIVNADEAFSVKQGESIQTNECNIYYPTDTYVTNKSNISIINLGDSICLVTGIKPGNGTFKLNPTDTTQTPQNYSVLSPTGTSLNRYNYFISTIGSNSGKTFEALKNAYASTRSGYTLSRVDVGTKANTLYVQLVGKSTSSGVDKIEKVEFNIQTTENNGVVTETLVIRENTSDDAINFYVSESLFGWYIESFNNSEVNAKIEEFGVLPALFFIIDDKDSIEEYSYLKKYGYIYSDDLFKSKSSKISYELKLIIKDSFIDDFKTFLNTPETDDFTDDSTLPFSPEYDDNDETGSGENNDANDEGEENPGTGYQSIIFVSILSIILLLTIIISRKNKKITSI